MRSRRKPVLIHPRRQVTEAWFSNPKRSWRAHKLAFARTPDAVSFPVFTVVINLYSKFMQKDPPEGWSKLRRIV
jgi:hypothetical protein